MNMASGNVSIVAIASNSRPPWAGSSREQAINVTPEIARKAASPKISQRDLQLII